MLEFDRRPAQRPIVALCIRAQGDRRACAQCRAQQLIW